MPIVAGDDGGALVFDQRLDQRVDALDVEVVRGLVHHEDVVLQKHELGEHEPRRLAARQRVGALEPCFAAEQELSDIADPATPSETEA